MGAAAPEREREDANEAGRRSSRPSEWTFFTFNTWDSQTAASTQGPLPRMLQGQEVVYGQMGAKQPCHHGLRTWSHAHVRACTCRSLVWIDDGGQEEVFGNEWK